MLFVCCCVVVVLLLCCCCVVGVCCWCVLLVCVVGVCCWCVVVCVVVCALCVVCCVLCVVCCGCCCKGLTEREVYDDKSLRSDCAGALDDKELFIIEGSENWRSTPGRPGGARKMPTPTSPPNPRKSPPSLHTGRSTNSGDELNLRHLQQETQANRDIDDNVSTATAESTVFCTDNPKHLSLNTTGMSTTFRRTESKPRLCTITGTSP